MTSLSHLCVGVGCSDCAALQLDAIAGGDGKEGHADPWRDLLERYRNDGSCEDLILGALRENDLLREALGQYGDRQRMATAPEHLQQAIDAAMAEHFRKHLNPEGAGS